MKNIIRIIPHKNFTKELKKQSQKTKDKIKTRMRIFMFNQGNPILNNHALTGKWRGHRSINISGDLRAVYIIDNQNTATFVALGTHSQLYG